MYCIRYKGLDKSIVSLVGELKSILELTNLLESVKVHFKVSNVAGFIVSQKEMGFSGYNYWMNKDVSFK